MTALSDILIQPPNAATPSSLADRRPSHSISIVDHRRLSHGSDTSSTRGVADRRSSTAAGMRLHPSTLQLMLLEQQHRNVTAGHRSAGERTSKSHHHHQHSRNSKQAQHQTSHSRRGSAAPDSVQKAASRRPSVVQMPVADKPSGVGGGGDVRRGSLARSLSER